MPVPLVVGDLALSPDAHLVVDGGDERERHVHAPEANPVDQTCVGRRVLANRADP